MSNPDSVDHAGIALEILLPFVGEELTNDTAALMVAQIHATLAVVQAIRASAPEPENSVRHKLRDPNIVGFMAWLRNSEVHSKLGAALGLPIDAQVVKAVMNAAAEALESDL